MREYNLNDVCESLDDQGALGSGGILENIVNPVSSALDTKINNTSGALQTQLDNTSGAVQTLSGGVLERPTSSGAEVIASRVVESGGYMKSLIEIVSGGSVGYIPVLSGGMCYRFTDPLVALSVGSVTSSLAETDILFTAGAIVSPPVSVTVAFVKGSSYSWVDDDDGGHDETTPFYGSITLTSSGTGYAYAVPASQGWYEEYRDDEGYTCSSYLSAGSFTCSSAGGKWVISAHNVKQVCYGEWREYDDEAEDDVTRSETTTRTVNGLIASSTDNMTTWSINNAVTIRYCHWDGDAWDWQDDNSPASEIGASSTVTPCDVVLPSGALLVNSSAVTVESGHRYEMNLKHGAIVTGEIMEASNE